MYELLGQLQDRVGRWGGRPPGDRIPTEALLEPAVFSGSRSFQPLRAVRICDGVVRTLFDEFREHKAGPRGSEEIGWLLLGWRDEHAAEVRATLPAGADRDSGEAHVRFNSVAQGVASRLVRQADKRLTLLGVVHTHPGSLRHPSSGDFRGDSLWVKHLRGGEGVFGIGTADGDAGPDIHQPHALVMTQRDLVFHWYSLRQGALGYQPIAMEIIAGPDCGAAVRSIWASLEANAEPLERLARRQARVTMEPIGNGNLAVTLPLENGSAVQLQVSPTNVRYFVMRNGTLLAADLSDHRIDRGVYRLLAELCDG